MPQVSIITPCYNSALYIDETIKSVINQTYSDWEIIITDDGSTDQSIDIIKQYNDPRIILLQTEKNGGAGHARNISLKKATGRYITFLDSDDYWEPTFLQKMVDFMQTNNHELVYSTYARCDENLNPTIADFEATKIITFNSLLRTCTFSLLSTMYDSKRVGKFYFPENTKREDHVMWLEVLKQIPNGYPIKECLAKYRMRATSVSRNKQNIIKDQYLVYKDYMKFSTIKSLYYTTQWALNGFKKYSNFFN